MNRTPLRAPARSRQSRISALLQLVIVICAGARLFYEVEDHLQRRPAPALAAGSIHACPVRIAAIVPVGPNDPRRTVARDFAVVLADARGENHVSGSLWISASGQPFSVAFRDRNALADDLGGSIDPIVVRLPHEARLEEAFVDRYDDGRAPRPCAIAGDWSGAMTAALHDDMAARIGTPADTGALAAQAIRDPEAACENRSASPQTLDDVPPSVPAEAIRKKLTGDVEVRLDLDASSVVTATTVIASPNSILNAASLDATRASLFRTAIRRCRPVPAKYIFVVSYLSDRH
jgi:hypothetical protein